MSSVAPNADVTNSELIAAIRAADARALNGLPDGKTVTEHCELAASTITSRVHRLDCVEMVDSRVLGQSGVVKTYKLEANDE